MAAHSEVKCGMATRTISIKYILYFMTHIDCYMLFATTHNAIYCAEESNS
jgi:hypothetical protein